MPIPMGYRAIADDLRARIKIGQYPPGSTLPTYPDLADHYDVSVSTMQRAMTILTATGWVRGRQGDRLYVAEELPEH